MDYFLWTLDSSVLSELTIVLSSWAALCGAGRVASQLPDEQL